MHFANTLIILTLVLYLCVLKFGQCYVNVALKKPTYQQYPAGQGHDKYDSSNAVDGLKTDLTWNGGQCVYSDARKTATWWVNLTTIYSIRHITINFMTGKSEFGPDNPYTSFFLGFSVYISNSTEMSQGTQCYKDDSFTTNTIPAVFTTICPIHGHYVIYYNERQPNVMYPNDYSPNVHNNLCEVEVHGCPVIGYYGSNCSFPCPDVNCQYCHIETGTCQGCKPGYRGHQCEIDCPYGFFGRNCANSCNKTCDGCNNVNGRCEFGCLPGWKGDSCQIACDKGSYGNDCKKTCGQCRETDQCRITDGRCLTGCDAGYQGDFCTESCKTGSFGFDCNETCGHCSEVNQCSDIDGICHTGCKAGYQGDLCRSSCDKGSYGVNCNQSCGFCHDANQCSHINGKCLSGCLAGYQGEICKTECDYGKYGINCQHSCGHCRGGITCNQVDGSCLDGCSEGYNGSLCIDHCEETFFGINCSQKCSINCSNQECNHVTGECIIFKQIVRASIELYFIGFFVGTIIICLGFLLYGTKKLYIQRTHSERNNANTSDINSEDVQVVEICISVGEENPNENNSFKKRPIADFAVINLDKKILENSKQEDDGFKKEFARLPSGVKFDCDVGKRPENRSKNRFKTTFPYDHSRIILNTDNSNYINANYIDGLEHENAYIATQGPKEKTVNDYWSMVWQKNVEQILMLTNLKEGTKKKCDQYWPDLKTCMDCGVFTLETTDEKKYAYYVIRTVKTTNKMKEETRKITQYHYIAWPDHGVPDPLCLLLFHNHVTRTKTSSLKGPTLVHCSAGIGRTGTYIAIDALHKEVQQGNKINIAEYVTTMREKRMNMVQTYEQYKTIFLTLYEITKAPVTVQKPAEFIEKLETAKMDTSANVSFLRDEFQRLMSVQHQRRDDNDKMASEGDGLSTTACIRPRYENVTIRTSSASNRGSNIDGIFIHSFTNQNAFIVTHCPSADDVADFLGLITEYDTEVVVFMEPLNSIESTDTWMPTPSKSSKSVPPFTIQLQQENTKETNWHSVEITKENTDFKPLMVHLAAPTQDLTSNNAQTVSQILGLVSFAQNTIGEGPIIVISKDGAALCGVFCAVYNLIQQLTMDEEIDVFSVVRLLQTRRPELCATMEEYEIINHAITTVIQSRTDGNTYANE